MRLSDAAHRTNVDHHRSLVRRAYDEAIDHGSWSAAGDLAEYLVETAADAPDRAHWTHRLGNARFNELDRDEATKRLIEAADLYEPATVTLPGRVNRSTATVEPNACCLALRTDFTRSGQRRHPQLDQLVEELIADESIDRQWRARSAAILAEVSWSAPRQDRRQQFVETAQALAMGVDEPLTEFMVHFRHRLASLGSWISTVQPSPSRSPIEASCASRIRGGLGRSLARRGLVALVAGDPMAAVSDATLAADVSAGASNWAEHGMAVAVRSVAATRLGRFADADNDTESTILSARRADASDPFLVSLSASIWRRAVRGDEAGVAALRDIGRQHQMYIPFAEFVAVALLRDVDDALEDVRPRWAAPRNGLSFRNLGFHLAQFEAASLAGNLEVVDELFPLFDRVYQMGVRATHDWPISIALAMAAAAIELGDDTRRFVDRALAGGASAAGSVLEQAIVDVYRSRQAFAWRCGARPSWTSGVQPWKRSTGWARRCSPDCSVSVSRRWSVSSECRPVGCGR